MKKVLVSILSIALVVALLFSMAGCSKGITAQGIIANEDGTFTVKIGNTASVAVYPTVYGPLVYGIEALSWYYGEYENDGKVKIELTNLDDGLNAETTLVNTQQLLEKYQVFSIVCGSAGTEDLIEEAESIMVYTPVTKDMYAEAGSDTRTNFFPIQPLDYIEGKQLIATAFAPDDAKHTGLGGKKVGIVIGDSTKGVEALSGIEEEAAKLGKVKNQDYFVQVVATGSTDYTAAVQACKDKGCDVVILDDVTFLSAAMAFVTLDYQNVDILASFAYSNEYYATAAYGYGVIDESKNRRLMTTGWISATLDSCVEDWYEYVKIMTLYAKHKGDPLVTFETDISSTKDMVKMLQNKFDWAKDGVSPYYYNSYTMAGYEGISIFLQGISRMYAKNKFRSASTEDYIKAMEKEPLKVPMSPITMDVKDGRRTGVSAMALVIFTKDNHSIGDNYRDFFDIGDLEKAMGK